MPKKIRPSKSRKPKASKPIEVTLMESVHRKLPDDIMVITALMFNYMAGGYQIEALRIGKKLIRLAPTDPRTHYNLACVLTSVGDYDGAVESLNSAFNCGFRDMTKLNNDEDLAPLFQRKKFIHWAEKVNALLQKENAA